MAGFYDTSERKLFCSIIVYPIFTNLELAQQILRHTFFF